jgi:hypothetical protein
MSTTMPTRRISMAMSASRIRSISNRSRFAEEAAFPGIRSERSEFAYNQKSSIPSQFRGDSMRTAFARAGLV